MKMVLRKLGVSIAQTLGTEFFDVETGQALGRALVFSWRGKIHLIGLKTVVRPMFLPQKRVTYWKQEIGFRRHPSPDFPSLHPNPPTADKSATLASSAEPKPKNRQSPATD